MTRKKQREKIRNGQIKKDIKYNKKQRGKNY